MNIVFTLRQKSSSLRHMRSQALAVADQRVNGICKSLNASLERHPLRSLGLIIILALVMDAGRIWTDLPIRKLGPVEDWWSLALNVAHGRGYVYCDRDYFPFCGPTNQVTAEREPVPVLLFAAVARLTGESLLAAMVVELVAHLVILLAVFSLAREMADVRIALLAALLWAVYLPAIRLVTHVLGDLLATAGLTWGLFFLSRARVTDRARHWLLAGIGLGLGILSRSASLMVGLVLTLGLLPWRRIAALPTRPLSLRHLKPAALFTATIAVMIAPWYVRNYVAFGRPLVGSSLTGYNLYRHNAILSADHYLEYVGPAEASRLLADLLNRRSDLRGTENEAQMDTVYRDEAVRIIASEPERYLLLSIYRLLPLWFDWGVKETYGESLSLLGYLIMVQQAALLSAAVVGLRRIGWRAWPVVVSIACVTLMYMATVGQLRYFVLVMPLVVVFSAVGALELAQRSKTYIRRQLFALAQAE